MKPEKMVRPTTATHAALSAPVSAYEIHAGRLSGPALARPFATLADGTPEGAVAAGGRVEATHLHGLFASDAFRRAWLERLRPGAASDLAFDDGIEAALDEVAAGMEQAMDLTALFALAEGRGAGA